MYTIQELLLYANMPDSEPQDFSNLDGETLDGIDGLQSVDLD